MSILPDDLSLDVTFQRGDHVEFAKKFLQQLEIDGEVVYADGNLYRFDGQIFRPVDFHGKSRRIQAFAGMPQAAGDGETTPLRIQAGDIKGTIMCAHSQVADQDFFTNAPKGIAFENGFLRFDTLELVEHSIHNRCRYKYPFAYEDRTPNQLLAFLHQVFEPDSDADQKIAELQEFGGACVFGEAPRYQKVLLMDGEGANGKKTTIDILWASMPPGSAVAIPPQQWGNEYRLAMLAGKLLNAVGELPENDIFESETFKAVVNGKSTTGRHIREAPFTFRAIAGHLFSANRKPSTPDFTHGFWRRWMILKFNRIFAEHEQDRHLAEKIIAAELPAIVAWFVRGMQRLIQQGSYTTPASSIQAVDEWRKTADQVALFIHDCTRPATDEEAGTKADELYLHYTIWARQNGHKQVANNTFGKRMAALKLGAVPTHAGRFYPVVRISPAERDKRDFHAVVQEALDKVFGQ